MSSVGQCWSCVPGSLLSSEIPGGAFFSQAAQELSKDHVFREQALCLGKA